MAIKGEKRTTRRYVCTGSARINVPGVQRSHPGRILDLSLGGCLVELKKGGPAYRQGAPIELTIQSQGAVFRVQGTIAKRTDKTLIGISFYRMSPRSRADLQKMIETMDHALSQDGLMLGLP